MRVADQLSNALALLADHGCLVPRLSGQRRVCLQLGGVALHERQRCADIVRYARDPLRAGAVALVEHRALGEQLFGRAVDVSGQQPQYTALGELAPLPLRQTADAFGQRRGSAVHAPAEQQG